MPGSAHTLPDFTGRVVGDGRYQIMRKLGNGSYGAVYQALDTTAQDEKSTLRAIKIMRKDNLSDKEVSNLQRELYLHRVMSADPGVVSYHHSFEDRHYVYVVLDFISGGDLFTKITKGDAYYRNDDAIKRDFVQILDAVLACHRKRIFHRDLKPENILCGEDGSIRLADFGLATTQRVSTTFGCGSSTYMSPECIGWETKKVPYTTKHNDTWALGVILVNMITLRSPWARATTKDDTFHDFIVDENHLLEVLPISKGANSIIKRMLQLEHYGRADLRAVRKAVLDVDTFFPTDEQVARAPLPVQLIWADYNAKFTSPKGTKGVRRVAKPQPKVVVPRAKPHAASPVANLKHTAAARKGAENHRRRGRLSPSGTVDSTDSEGPLTPVDDVTPPIVFVKVPSLFEQDLGDASLLETLNTKPVVAPCPLRVIKGSGMVMV
ncbi:hypothetical protein EIP91_006516 [Steccherinum ochraceum]|uniref:Protein kinase domain-containing protein n=1 Tax=Steccherinum ochraceum TaxID=92696 RepID=A0A4R0RG84_9APHY|nr:hypothetical protein EIP91_006516 [Steccherinum ochraceum]